MVTVLLSSLLFPELMASRKLFAAFSAAALFLYWSRAPNVFFLRMRFPSACVSYQRKSHTRSPLPFADNITHPFWYRAVFMTTSFSTSAEAIGTISNVPPICSGVNRSFQFFGINWLGALLGRRQSSLERAESHIWSSDSHGETRKSGH
jgi:hypothetical protein